MSSDLAFALSLADDADAIALARFRAADLHVETKPDLTPVSEADRASRRRCGPGSSASDQGEPVLGEEEGGDRREGWIIDPIDGTRNYTRGIPVWATQIAFATRSRVVSAPALGRRWWAERGAGAYADGERIHVSASSGSKTPPFCTGAETGLDWTSGAWHLRGFGDFWAHMLVAEGAAEVAVDAPELAIWDRAPMKIIVEEAGGRFDESVSWNGRLDVSGLR